MLKHIVVIIIFSFLVLTFMPYAQQGLQAIVDAHTWVSDALTQVFTGGETGNIIRGMLALLAIPVAIAFIPTIIYWLAKRHWFPYFMEVVWVVWLVQASAVVLLYKAAV